VAEFTLALVVAPFQYTELLGATLIGFLVFSSFPDNWTWFGAALIIVAGLYIGWRERDVSRRVTRNDVLFESLQRRTMQSA